MGGTDHRHRHGRLTVKGNIMGPENQFGHIMGQVPDAPVLLLKSCIGNRSLGWAMAELKRLKTAK